MACGNCLDYNTPPRLLKSKIENFEKLILPQLTGTPLKVRLKLLITKKVSKCCACERYAFSVTTVKQTRVYEGPLIAEAVEELRILKMLIFRPEAVILKSAFR